MAYSKAQKLGFKIIENFRKEVEELGFELFNYHTNDWLLDRIVEMASQKDFEKCYNVFNEIQLKINEDIYIKFENIHEFSSSRIEKRAIEQYSEFKDYVLFKNKEYNDLKIKYDLLKISLDGQEKTKRRM